MLIFCRHIEIINLLPAGHLIGEPQPLFTKIEPEVIEEYKKKFAGSQESRKSPPKKVTIPDLCNGDAETLEEAIAKQVIESEFFACSGFNSTNFRDWL